MLLLIIKIRLVSLLEEDCTVLMKLFSQGLWLREDSENEQES